MSKFLTTTYTNPDLDGFSSAIAYAELLNKTGHIASPVFFGTPQDEVRVVMEKFKFTYPEQVKDIENYEQIALLDHASIGRLDPLINPKKVTEIIDHHTYIDLPSFPNLQKKEIKLVGACASLVANRFKEQIIEISEMSAVLLYMGIVSNSINFKSTESCEVDVQADTWLKTKINIPDNFIDEFWRATTFIDQNNIKQKIAGDTKIGDFSANNIYLVAQIDTMDAKTVIKNYLPNILAELKIIFDKDKYNYCFLSILDLKAWQTYFITEDKKTSTVLEDVFGVKFKNNVAILDKFILRKEVILKLKENSEA